MLSSIAQAKINAICADPLVGAEIAAILNPNNQTGLTALAGGGQAGATLCSKNINRFTTVASGNDSCVLPVANAAGVPGLIAVINAGGANSMNVYPAVGDAINAIAANSPFALANNKIALFVCTGAGQWHSILTA